MLPLHNHSSGASSLSTQQPRQLQQAAGIGVTLLATKRLDVTQLLQLVHHPWLAAEGVDGAGARLAHGQKQRQNGSGLPA